MDISVTQFRANCLELIRQVETGGEAIDTKRVSASKTETPR